MLTNKQVSDLLKTKDKLRNEIERNNPAPIAREVKEDPNIHLIRLGEYGRRLLEQS